ncbi:MAG: hypothetical protein QXD66_01015 [Candidatus Nezhaarchaeales archaeon]|nr:MAG: hypothetical protein DSO06_04595 [Candidatus Nezhaarchaeota archaeon WYZ-LMO8]
MIEIVVLGKVSNVMLNFIGSCVSEVVRVFDIDPRILRLILAESREKLEEFIEIPLAQPLSSISHLYVAGKPTVFVIASELYDKSETVVRGELLIALAHARLHGSEEYYAIKLPKGLQRMLSYGASEEAAMAALYLVASGVKGYEATRFVANRGYLVEMKEVHKLHLRITPEERVSWAYAEGSPQLQALLTLNTFKALANSLPIRDLDEELNELFEENLNIIPLEFRRNVEKALFAILPQEPQTTFDRIEACLEALNDVISMALL